MASFRRVLFLLLGVILILGVGALIFKVVGTTAKKVADAEARDIELASATAYKIDTLMALSLMEEGETKTRIVDLLSNSILLKSKVGDPLAVAKSAERDGMTSAFMGVAMKALQGQFAGQVSAGEVGLIEQLELTCGAWKTLSSNPTGSFELNEDTQTRFYQSLTEQVSGGTPSLQIMSALYVPKLVNENFDLIEARFCQGCDDDESPTRVCSECWDLYQTYAGNEQYGKAIDEMMDARCSVNCGQVCQAVESGMANYHNLLEAASGEEKVFYLNAFINEGIVFN